MRVDFDKLVNLKIKLRSLTMEFGELEISCMFSAILWLCVPLKNGRKDIKKLECKFDDH